MTKFIALAIGIVGLGLALYAWSRKRTETMMSDRWLLAQEQRDSTAGVDLPRWRTPKERAAMGEDWRQPRALVD